jgi:uncharacterized protein (DUF1501 family)
MLDWFACDGNGAGNQAGNAFPRRAFVQGGVAAALAAWLGQSALHHAAFADPTKETGRDTLVVLFLRGGADGLSVIAPYGEDAYHRSRPTLALSKNDVLDMNGFFGLHPALKNLYPLYREGKMAAIHAVGSGDKTRSHFEAMATMERGLTNGTEAEKSGWLARHLVSQPVEHASPLRAVAFGSLLPDALRGAPDTSVVGSVDEFRLQIPDSSPVLSTLASLYKMGSDPVIDAGRGTLEVLDALKRINPANYRPANGAKYPNSDLGTGLRQVATLIRANVGLEVACLDRGGWDTHVGQGTTQGWLATQLADVGDSLGAFAKDLGDTGLRRVTILVMTEFGRRVQENSGLGTDHGRASVMFAIGGGVNGGKVYGKWPGLETHQLEEEIDLAVANDYRSILSALISARLNGGSHLPTIFPTAGSDLAPLTEIFRPA